MAEPGTRSGTASRTAKLTDNAVMFLMMVLGTVPTPVHVGLLNRRLSSY